MARRTDTLEFRPPDWPETLLAEMQRIHDGGHGWVNFTPGVHPDDMPPPPMGLAAIFGGNNAGVPLCTWTPGRSTSHGLEPGSLGVLHRSGTKAATRIVAYGVELPAGWRVVQDHPRRGLVVRIPPETSAADALTWLVEAGKALSVVPLTGDWLAQIHRTG